MFTKNGKMIDAKSMINISLSGPNLKYFTIYLNAVDYNKQIDTEISESLLQSFPGAIAVLKHNFMIDINRTFEELIGAKSHLLNKGISKIISPNFREEFENFIVDDKQKNHENLITILTEEGNEIEVRFEKIYVNKEKNVVILSIDSETLELKQKFEESKRFTNEFTNFDQVFWNGHLENNGIIIDSQTNELLPFANVGVKNSVQGASSDFNGKFIIKITKYSNNTFFIYNNFNSSTTSLYSLN